MCWLGVTAFREFPSNAIDYAYELFSGNVHSKMIRCLRGF